MAVPKAEPVLKKKKLFVMPDAYVLLFIAALLCAIASYIVPAGEFDRVTKGSVTSAVPGSYHSLDQSPVSPIAFLPRFRKG